MRARIYDAVTVLALLERVGLVDLEMALFKTRPELMYISAFLARKPE